MDGAMLVGVGAVLTGIAAVVTAVMNGRKIGAVHDEVRTLNESTLGELGANIETRRVEDIPHDKRTKQEQRHLDDSPPDAPPQGPSR